MAPFDYAQGLPQDPAGGPEVLEGPLPICDVRCAIGDVRCEMCDVGCAMRDVGCGMWDMRERRDTDDR